MCGKLSGKPTKYQFRELYKFPEIPVFVVVVKRCNALGISHGEGERVLVKIVHFCLHLGTLQALKKYINACGLLKTACWRICLFYAFRKRSVHSIQRLKSMTSLSLMPDSITRSQKIAREASRKLYISVRSDLYKRPLLRRR